MIYGVHAGNKARCGTAPCLAHGGPQRFLQRLPGTCPPGHPAVALTKASPPGLSCLFFLVGAAQTNLARLRISIGSTSFSLIISRPSLSFSLLLVLQSLQRVSSKQAAFFCLIHCLYLQSPLQHRIASHRIAATATQPAAIQFSTAKRRKKNSRLATKHKRLAHADTRKERYSDKNKKRTPVSIVFVSNQRLYLNPVQPDTKLATTAQAKLRTLAGPP